MFRQENEDILPRESDLSPGKVFDSHDDAVDIHETIKDSQLEIEEDDIIHDEQASTNDTALETVERSPHRRFSDKLKGDPKKLVVETELSKNVVLSTTDEQICLSLSSDTEFSKDSKLTKNIKSFNNFHSWKTLAKVSSDGREGCSVVTVPCDGKADLLKCETPLESPLPTGILEQPIASTEKKKEIYRNFLMDKKLEDPELYIKGVVHSESLYREKGKPGADLSYYKNELDTSPDAISHTEDEGILVYEEDSDDGADRKLQDLDDEDESLHFSTTRKSHSSDPYYSTKYFKLRNLQTINEQSCDDTVPETATNVASNLKYETELEIQNKPISEKDKSKDANCDDDFGSTIASLKEAHQRMDNFGLPVNKKETRRNAGNNACIINEKGAVGASGTLFNLRLFGSIEVSEEDPSSKNSGKRSKKDMVTEAVHKLKVR